MNEVWTTDIETMLHIYELAKAHGKKPDENIQDEFDTIRKLYPGKFTSLGITDMDKDLIVGNLREEGKKILNLDEINNI
jgi:predicted  nucleic acid-binding Zn-ribbon protein